jgi:hypothetical protein
MKISHHAIERSIQRRVPIMEIIEKGVCLCLSQRACVYKYLYKEYVAIVNSGVVTTVYKNGVKEKMNVRHKDNRQVRSAL